LRLLAYLKGSGEIQPSGSGVPESIDLIAKRARFIVPLPVRVVDAAGNLCGPKEKEAGQVVPPPLCFPLRGKSGKPDGGRPAGCVLA
jgi:hypothetical protein